ncbi:MAG: CDP-diacylglycerol--glycerol-3-phosphate 3-phosphatidyltransferase [Phycisphaerales bacterium]|nr:CDP-diacylglycerol--glycerol-3-phosphate 3-phosphatidyltransferase [Phycisphaerales bacterium]
MSTLADQSDVEKRGAIAAPPTPLVISDPGVVRRHLPNALTLVRVVLAVAFVVILSRWRGTPHLKPEVHPLPDWNLIAAGLMFVVAAVTDAFDGHLSRKWRVTSQFGRIMDPFADKVLVIGAFVCLAGPAFTWPVGAGQTLQVSAVQPWMAIVVLARELLVTSLRGLIESQGGNFAANWAGKAKMILQSVAVPTIIGLIALFETGPGAPARTLIQWLVWFTIAATIVSGIPYVFRAMAQLRTPARPANGSAP